MNRSPKRREIWWGYKLHPSSAKKTDAKTFIDKHQAFAVEGKDRTILVIRQTENKREGQKHFRVVNVSRKHYGTSDTISIKFNGNESYLHPPAEETAENLFRKFECEIPEIDFREYKQKLRVLAMKDFQ